MRARAAVVITLCVAAAASAAHAAPASKRQAFAVASTLHRKTVQLSPEATASPTPLRILALGDSDATGSGDPTQMGWVGRYARLLRQRLGLRVTVRNLAQEGETSGSLLTAVRADAATRGAIQAADIVLLGIGGADLNAGDDRWQAGKCRGKACYTADLEAFGRNFEATIALIRKLRGSANTVLRATTFTNALTGAEGVIPPFLKPVATTIGVYQAETLQKEICASMRRHGGRCIDELHAFNGPAGIDNAYSKGLLNHADCCYPSGRGQQLIAQLLFDTGLKPVR